MLILIDQDAVLTDFCASFIRIWNRIGVSPALSREAITNFDIEELSGDPALARSIMCQPGFFLDMEPIPGAAHVVNEIVDAGHEVLICTAPLVANRHCIPEKQEWIERHLGAPFLKKIIFTNDKTLVRGDVLIDDKPNITGIRAPQWQRIVFDAPYNRHLAGPRISDWMEWRSVISELEHKPAEPAL